MRDHRKFEELLPEEFDAEIKRSPIVYCPFGPMEYHGLYNALGIDAVIARKLCLRAAAISGGIVFPMVPIAPGGYTMEKFENRDKLREMAPKVYPSLFIGVDLCERLYTELFESFAEDLGFKVCVAIGGHAPAEALVRKIADSRGGAISGMKLFPCGCLSRFFPMDIVKAEHEKLGIRRINHAGMWETSMHMACSKDNVDLSKIEKPCPAIFEAYPVKEDYPGNVYPTVSELALTSLDFGEKLLRTATERIAAEATKLLGQP